MVAAHVSTVSRPLDRRVLLTSVATGSTTSMRLIKTLLTATATVMSRPHVSPRILARDVSLDGRSPNSKMWGPPTAKRFKMVKMCPRKKCGLEPERCFCICKECHRPLRGLKRCGRPGCPFGANRSPEVETPPPESPPRARLPSMNPSLLSRWPYDRPPRPDSWTERAQLCTMAPSPDPMIWSVSGKNDAKHPCQQHTPRCNAVMYE